MPPFIGTESADHAESLLPVVRLQDKYFHRYPYCHFLIYKSSSYFQRKSRSWEGENKHQRPINCKSVTHAKGGRVSDHRSSCNIVQAAKAWAALRNRRTFSCAIKFYSVDQREISADQDGVATFSTQSRVPLPNYLISDKNCKQYTCGRFFSRETSSFF